MGGGGWGWEGESSERRSEGERCKVYCEGRGLNVREGGIGGVGVRVRIKEEGKAGKECEHVRERTQWKVKPRLHVLI